MLYAFCEKDCKGRDKSSKMERISGFTWMESKILTVDYYFKKDTKNIQFTIFYK